METPTTTPDNDMTLHADRTVIGSEAPTPTPTASVRDSSTTETVNRVAAPQVVASFDWKKWFPWIIGAIILILLVWLLTRKRGGGSVAA